MAAEKLIIYTDGGSRGNPGPAAIGAVVGNKEYSQAIGNTTNNIAEYSAVIFALKKAKQLLTKNKARKTHIELYTDSELLVNQLNAKYKIKDTDLVPLFIEAWNLKQDFASVKFIHVLREKNKLTDRLVNRALDTLGI
ncbi:MAG: ribonuclease HI family protein [Candidatus Colwellbacteria bacterium]|nr:ribonuclease HI family protein [Candidatus Colwellbacteria bacterium]